MVLYRPSLGRRGSYAPTALNVLQNIGWGSFELIIIGTASAAVSKRVFGFGGRPMWTIAFGVIVTLMAVSGPLLIVARWIKRYAVWLVLASSIYLTAYVLVKHPLSTFLHAHGQGMPFWQGVDLVVAMPISWIPLAADYTRFSRSKSNAFVGSAIGYGVAQAWFYFLGVILILSNVAKNPDNPTSFITAVLAVPVGLLAMVILAVDETDEPFANIYSASVSVQNAFPRLSQRRLSIGIGALCTLLAVVVPLVQYQNFLLLIGAVFVPLFGVLAAHYAVVRRGYRSEDIYGEIRTWRPWGVVAWLAGFATYNWLNPGTVTWWVSAMKAVFGGAGTSTFPWASASIASFVVAFVLQAAERLLAPRRPV